MAHCTYCSAPLPANSIICEYCNNRNDTDLTTFHHYTTNTVDSARICPRCAVSLKTIDLKINGRFLIERCDQCLGLFFDPGELEAVLEASVANVFDINRGRLDSINSSMRADNVAVTYIKCPVCSKLMNRVNFGARSGVIVDRCRDHGVWLDGGELRHLFEWMKAGGKILSREREEEARREAAREMEREKRNIPADRQISDYSSFDLYGGGLKNSDPDLFELIKKAVRLFT